MLRLRAVIRRERNPRFLTGLLGILSAMCVYLWGVQSLKSWRLNNVSSVAVLGIYLKKNFTYSNISLPFGIRICYSSYIYLFFSRPFVHLCVLCAFRLSFVFENVVNANNFSLFISSYIFSLHTFHVLLCICSIIKSTTSLRLEVIALAVACFFGRFFFRRVVWICVLNTLYFVDVYRISFGCVHRVFLSSNGKKNLLVIDVCCSSYTNIAHA